MDFPLKKFLRLHKAGKKNKPEKNDSTGSKLFHKNLRIVANVFAESI